MSDSNLLFETNEVVLKKKILSVREHYDFEDLKGTKLGAAEGNILQFPPKFVLFDNHGSELMHLEGKIVSIRNQFTIYDNQGAELGTIKKKTAKLIGEEFWIEINGVEFMRIYGDFTDHDYQFEFNGYLVASVHKKWVTLRDQIDISMSSAVDHRVIIGAVIVIEHIEVNERQNRH
jgi:uncharacterized protein YxjI